MKVGDVVLIRMGQVGAGPTKLRPALILALLPGPYQNVLICGISTQLHQLVTDWDESIGPGDGDFAQSGLRAPSAVRLSYLYAAEGTEIVGVIGRVDAGRVGRLCGRSARRLTT